MAETPGRAGDEVIGSVSKRGDNVLSRQVRPFRYADQQHVEVCGRQNAIRSTAIELQQIDPSSLQPLLQKQTGNQISGDYEKYTDSEVCVTANELNVLGEASGAGQMSEQNQGDGNCTQTIKRRNTRCATGGHWGRTPLLWM